MGARPNRYPSFCTAPAPGALVEFPGGIVSAGFSSERRPAAQWFNYALNLWGGWINCLRGPSPTNWTRNPWGVTAFDAAVFIAADATTLETTAAVSRFVVAGNIGGAIKVYSSLRGVAFTDRTASLPGGLIANPVLGLANVVALDSPPFHTSAFYLWTDAQLVMSVGVTGWALTTLPGGYKPRGVASAPNASMFVAACEAGATLVWAHSTNGSVFVAGGITGAPTGSVQGVVWSGSHFVFLTSQGEVWRTPDTLSAITKDATIATSANWRLATGAAGEVVAYEVGVVAPKIRRSTDHGATWATINPPAEVRNLTRLLYVDHAWIATTTEAPYVWTTNDLMTWSRGVLPVPETGTLPLADVGYADGAIVATGSGYVYVSHRALDAGPGAADGLLGTVVLADAAFLQGREIDTAAPFAGDVLGWTGAKWSPVIVDAARLQGQNISVASPTEGQALVFNGAQWAPNPDVVGRVQTNDATPTTIATFTVPAQSVVGIRVTITAIKDDGSLANVWHFSAGVKRAGGGAVLIDSGSILITPLAEEPAWIASLQVSGNDLLARGEGDVATTINWTAHIEARAPGSY